MPEQAILFPDVEAWAVGYLVAALARRTEPHAADVYVAAKLPQTRRARMVIVRRDGGPRLDLVREAARLSVRVYGRTEQETGDLAALVRALLGAAADGKPVLRVRELSGPTPVEDTAKGAPDYRLQTVELLVRGTPL